MVKSGMLVVATSLIVSIHASADNRPREPLPAAQNGASDMSDADVLAERHLALYRVSRAATFVPKGRPQRVLPGRHQSVLFSASWYTE